MTPFKLKPLPRPLLGCLLALMVCLSYVPALQGGFIWDDDDYVTRNQALRSTEGLRAIWLSPGATPQYYPMVFTTFWLEYRAWGLNPAGFHAVNVGLHLACALLLWQVLSRLGVRGAYLAALLFAIHPVHVESVAWISERKNVFSGVFYLGAALCYLRFFDLSPQKAGGHAGERKALWYVFGTGLFLLALLSKTVTCSLPAALLLALWWKRGRVARSEIAAIVPLLLLGVCAGLLTAWLERHHVGASGLTWDLSLLERTLIAARALWFYLGKLAFPGELIFNYPRWAVDAAQWRAYLFPVGALGSGLALWALRNRWGKGPLVAMLFFAGTLFPALGFIDVYPFRYSFVADHFQYLASIGPLALAASLIALCLRRPALGRIALPLLLAAVALLGMRTWDQGRDYKDLKTLWRATLARNPDSWIGHNNLGVELHQEGNVGEAMSHYREALRLFPEYSEAHNNMGSALAGLGRTEEALVCYRRALAVDAENALAHYNLGVELASLGQSGEARKHYEEALRITPDYAEAHNNLGLVLAHAGDQAAASRSFLRALEHSPDMAEALFNLGRAYANMGSRKEAESAFHQAVVCRPAYPEAHNALGAALARRGKADRALAHFEEAVRLEPGYAEAVVNQGILLHRMGKPEEALKRIESALKMQPENPDLHVAGASVLGALERDGEAILHYEEALRLAPDHVEAHVNLGAALAARGDLSGAVLHFTEAVRIHPRAAEARVNLIRALWITGRFEAAHRGLEALERLDPQKAAALRAWIEQSPAAPKGTL